MRTYALFLLTLLILTACSNPSVTQIFISDNPMATATIAPTQRPTEKPISIPTEKPSSEPLNFNSTFPDQMNPEIRKKYSIVNLESFRDGTILAKEKEYLQNNKIFTDEVIDRTSLILESHETHFSTSKISVVAKNINFFTNNKDKNPNTRPIKIFSYYIFYDHDLFLSMGLDKVAAESGTDTNKLSDQLKNNGFLLIAAWAYHNPDKTITVGHSLIDRAVCKADFNRAKELQPNLDYKFLPAYAHANIIFSDKAKDNFFRSWTFLDNLWNKYPDLKPEPFIDKWADSGQMPKELETKLFTLQAYSTFW